MRASIALLVLLGVLPWLAGCATTPAHTEAPDAAAAGASKATRADRDRALGKLQKGMSADQVRTAWGEPAKVAPMEAPTGKAEVWTYVFSFAGPARQVQTGETTYNRPNPITNVDETIRVPVFSTEQVMIEQTVELLFYDGTLTEWKQSRELERTYN